MASCSVSGCKSSQRKKENQDPEINLKFHRFPKDKHLQDIWIKFCNRDNVNAKYARLCSLHFEESAYRRNLKYELLQEQPRYNQIVLQYDTVPTLI